VERPPGSECPDRDTLASLVESIVEEVAFVAPELAALHIRLRFAERPLGGWRMTLEATTADDDVVGRRTIEDPGPECRTLEAAAALVTALTIDPSATPSSSQAEASTEQGAGEDATSTEVPLNPPAESHTDASADPQAGVTGAEVPVEGTGWRYGASVGAGVVHGLVPDTAMGAELSGWVVPSGFAAVELGLSYGFIGEAVSPEGTAEFDSMAARVALCPSWSLVGPVSVQTCGGFQIGLIRFTGHGFTERDLSSSRALANGHFAAKLSARLGGVMIARLSTFAVIPLIRDRFTYFAADGREPTLHRPSSLAFSGLIEIGFELGS